MSDTTAEKSALDVVSPYGVHYTVQQVWVLDSTTNIPVGVRDVITYPS
jgi:hypothetical protein